jgi:hypothetical protein
MTIPMTWRQAFPHGSALDLAAGLRSAAQILSPEDEMAESLTSADFHIVVQKQLLNSVFDSLAKSKLDWTQIAPFAEAARQLCRGDFEATGRLRVHAVRAEGEAWVESEEAYVGLSVTDREEGKEWLNETWWLSDLITAENDREQAKKIVEALERSIVRIRQWIADGEDRDLPSTGHEEH